MLWTALANLIIYSWASERFPWLVVHPLLPLILLAGLGAERVWHALPRRGMRVAGAAAVGIVLTTLAVPVVYVAPTDPAELLVAVQTSGELAEVHDRIQEIYDAAPGGSLPQVVVDTGLSATWPWAWYLRDRPVLYADLAADPAAAAEKAPDVVLALAANVPRLPAPRAAGAPAPTPTACGGCRSGATRAPRTGPVGWRRDVRSGPWVSSMRSPSNAPPCPSDGPRLGEARNVGAQFSRGMPVATTVATDRRCDLRISRIQYLPLLGPLNRARQQRMVSPSGEASVCELIGVARGRPNRPCCRPPPAAVLRATVDGIDLISTSSISSISQRTLILV